MVSRYGLFCHPAYGDLVQKNDNFVGIYGYRGVGHNAGISEILALENKWEEQPREVNYHIYGTAVFSAV